MTTRDALIGRVAELAAEVERLQHELGVALEKIRRIKGYIGSIPTENVPPPLPTPELKYEDLRTRLDMIHYHCHYDEAIHAEGK